jgi:hypothetical protein
MKKYLSFIFISSFITLTGFAQDLIPTEYNNKFGYNDTSGKIVIAAKYNLASEFMGNIAAVSINEKWGIIDKKGNELTKIIYDKLMPEPQKPIVWVIIGTKMGLINLQGKEISPIQYDNTQYFYSEKLAPVQKGENWGFIDFMGKEVVKCKYKSVANFSNERAWISNGNGIGFINEQGIEIIPFKFSEAEYYFDDNGLCKVQTQKDGDYTLIDKNGSSVFSYYKQILRFDTKTYALKTNSGINFVNAKNQLMGSTAYRRLTPPLEGEKVRLWRVENSNGKLGFINENMKIAINCIYDDAESFFNGLCIVKLKNRWGIIDTTGKEIIPFQYESIKNTFNYDANYVAKKEGKEYQINSKGELLN